MKWTEYFIYELHPQIKPILPDKITFIHAEELVKIYPHSSPKERDDKIVEQHKAVCTIGIGGELSDGQKHDGRAPDYDDWITPSNGYNGLDGDILVWNPVLQRSFELSSMGIRVRPESLMQQLEITGNTDRKELYFHSRLTKR